MAEKRHLLRKIRNSILLVSLLATSACHKEEFHLLSENVHALQSSFTNQEYEIKVLVPKNYDEQHSYPTVYLLDGFFHFNDVGRLFDEEAHLQEVILVGIFYKQYPFALSNLGKIEELREIDLTYPVHVTPDGEELGGGGLLFYEFLSEELVPFIETRYSTDSTDRCLMGHSLGGYFSLFQMLEFRSNPLFQNVVALSPSLWWSDLQIIQKELNVHENGLELPFTLYIGIGSQEGVEGNALVDELDERIKTHNYADLNYRMERYGGGHLHSAKTGFKSALKFIFQ